MEILFEDRNIIVCVKPAGILSQADINGNENMIALLEAHSGTTVYPLHRLDKEVGGVMVYAKAKNAAAILSRDIAEHHFKKEYLAIVHGVPQEKSATLRDLLFKDSAKNKSYVVKRMRRGVKEAVLSYEVSDTAEISGENYSLVSVMLKTGRTHQIRVQFASRKMPLAGDRRYGAKDGFKNIMLWSDRLTFVNPTDKKEMTFSKRPESFPDIFKKF